MPDYNPTRPRTAPGPNRGGTNQPPPPVLPPPQTQTYFTTDGRLNRELLDQTAETVAKGISSLSHTQLRRFYEDVQAIRRKLDVEFQESGWTKDQTTPVPIELLMLKAKVAYARGRNNKDVPEAFLQFIINHAEGVTNLREFWAFCQHFQAVVAFHKFFGARPDPERERP